MNTPEPAPSTLQLPDLQNAIVDPATVGQLFRDIELCTEVTEIIPKFAAKIHVAETSIGLAEARELLFTERARAVQIRYRYEGVDWWDTIMNIRGQFQVVRIRHDFSGENSC